MRPEAFPRMAGMYENKMEKTNMKTVKKIQYLPGVQSWLVRRSDGTLSVRKVADKDNQTGRRALVQVADATGLVLSRIQKMAGVEA